MDAVLDLASGCPVPDFTTFLAFQKYFICRFFIIRHYFPLMIAAFR